MSQFEKISWVKQAMPGLPMGGSMLAAAGPMSASGMGMAEDSSGQTLERALATLARSAVQERAPELLNKELGFQLMDKNEEGDRVFGILAFQLGRRIVYVPVFFIDGEIKGTEVLYVTKTDLCVPLKEKWVHQLSQQKMHDIGAAVDKNEIRRGQRSPDLYSLIESPQKYASLREVVKSDLPAIKRALHARSPVPTRGGLLLHAVQKLGARVLIPLHKMASAWPPLYDYLDKFYGEKLARAIRSAPRKVERPLTLLQKTAKTRHRGRLLDFGSSRDKVQVLHYSQLIDGVKQGSVIAQELRASLSEQEKEKLRRDGFLVKDARADTEVAHVYRVATTERMITPPSCGLYDIVLENGRTMPAIVSENYALNASSTGGSMLSNYVVVGVNEQTGGVIGTALIERCHVWALEKKKGARPRKRGGSDRWRSFIAQLPSVPSWARDNSGKVSDSNRKVLLFLGPNEEVFGPIVLMHSNGSVAGKNGQRYSFSAADAYPYNFMLRRTTELSSRRRPENSTGPVGIPADGHCVVFMGGGIKSDEIYYRTFEMFVPDDWKVLELSMSQEDVIRWPSDTPYPARNPSIIDRQIYEHTDPLKIYGDAERVRVNDGPVESQKEAVLRLITDYGLREQTARDLVKEALLKGRHGEHLTYRIKFAAPMNAGVGPTMPSIPDPREGPSSLISENLPTQYAEERVLGVTDALTDDRLAQDTYRYDPNELDPSLMRAVQQAAQTGQKELFDTNVLASIVNATGDDMLITRYLGDLVRGMDRCGRILLTLYWRNKYFEERYGRESLPELEEGLRNNFDTLGDLVLLLKTRDVSILDSDDLIDDISGIET